MSIVSIFIDKRYLSTSKYFKVLQISKKSKLEAECSAEVKYYPD
jgi:hypothetical protein